MATILIIDDSVTVAKVFQGFLTRAGHQVGVAGDGASGLAAARAVPPDLVLLDFVLPDMNGTEICTQLKNDPQFKSPRVILLTGSHNEQVAQAGADLYLTKDCGPGRVLQAVRELLVEAR